jgi:hypothetical protein
LNPPPIGSAQSKFGHFFKVQEATWTEDSLQFRVSALGQIANGNILVADDHVRLEIVLCLGSLQRSPK